MIEPTEQEIVAAARAVTDLYTGHVPSPRASAEAALTAAIPLIEARVRGEALGEARIAIGTWHQTARTVEEMRSDVCKFLLAREQAAHALARSYTEGQTDG